MENVSEITAQIKQGTMELIQGKSPSDFDNKAIVQYCFLVFRRIGEYISLDLFYFVNLTSSCRFIHSSDKTQTDIYIQDVPGELHDLKVQTIQGTYS